MLHLLNDKTHLLCRGLLYVSFYSAFLFYFALQMTIVHDSLQLFLAGLMSNVNYTISQMHKHVPDYQRWLYSQ